MRLIVVSFAKMPILSRLPRDIPPSSLISIASAVRISSQCRAQRLSPCIKATSLRKLPSSSKRLINSSASPRRDTFRASIKLAHCSLALLMSTLRKSAWPRSMTSRCARIDSSPNNSKASRSWLISLLSTRNDVSWVCTWSSKWQCSSTWPLISTQRSRKACTRTMYSLKRCFSRRSAKNVCRGKPSISSTQVCLPGSPISSSATAACKSSKPFCKGARAATTFLAKWSMPLEIAHSAFCILSQTSSNKLSSLVMPSSSPPCMCKPSLVATLTSARNCSFSCLRPSNSMVKASCSSIIATNSLVVVGKTAARTLMPRVSLLIPTSALSAKMTGTTLDSNCMHSNGGRMRLATAADMSSSTTPKLVFSGKSQMSWRSSLTQFISRTASANASGLVGNLW
mmetsp:Transcript_110598/g.311924  ORF Transcript_110598/g.311924 Transcript_110598/m.311924 type:complete len:398 (-) Transcript_110598:43-1236(-)